MSFRRKITRRQFIKGAAIAGGAMMMPMGFGVRSAYPFAQSKQLGKWIQPLQGLGNAGVPVLSATLDPIIPNTDFYNIGVAEFSQQLHPQLGNTTLWGYYDKTTGIKRHLGGVIVATRGVHSRLRVTNELTGAAATHILPVDTTVPQPASQAHNRICVHQHGGYMPWWADGGPHHWFDPAGVGGLSFIQGPGTQNPLAGNPGYTISAGQADYFYPNFQSTRLTWYHDHAWGITRLNAYAGIASAYLIIDPAQEAAAVNIPPINPMVTWIPLVFQDKIFVDPLTIAIGDPTWNAVAPAKSRTLGSLWYAHTYNPKEFRQFKGKKALTPPDPSCVPEFFGDTMLCNGTVYPLATVEAKRYRFAILNACNARFLNINVVQAPTSNIPNQFPDVMTDPKTLFVNPALTPAGPDIIQIGTEGGYLARPVTYTGLVPFNPLTNTGQLIIGTGERVDIIIDFTGKAGQEFVLYNDAPGPFPAGPPSTDYFLGNPKNPVQPLAGTGPDTRQILRFKVVAAGTPDPQPPASAITLPPLDPPPLVTMPAVPPAPVAGVPRPPYAPLVPNVAFTTRQLTLNEDFDQWGRLRQLLGTTLPAPLGGFGLDYMAPTTEFVVAGAVEVWQIFNNTADTHPMHFHLVNGMVLSRQPFKLAAGTNTFTPSGVAQGPEQDELGWKETIKMHPGTVTSVIFKFDLSESDPAFPTAYVAVPNSTRTGGKEYVWHCHILEHEEHDMMRPLVVI
jgi:spore coat protein A